MPFIPDEAVRAGREVSPSARTLYEIYCLYRDAASGLSRVEDDTAMNESGMAHRTLFRAKKELRERRWIEEEGKLVRCTKGRFPGQPEPIQVSNDCASPAVCIYEKVFGYKPPIFQQELIAGRVKDLSVYEKTLRIWAGNNWKADSVGSQLDRYDKEVKWSRGDNERRERQKVAAMVGGPAKSIPSRDRTAEEEGQLIAYAAEIRAELERENREPVKWERDLLAQAEQFEKQRIA